MVDRAQVVKRGLDVQPVIRQRCACNESASSALRFKKSLAAEAIASLSPRFASFSTRWSGWRLPFEVVEYLIGKENMTGPAAAWGLQLSLSYLDHLEALGEAQPIAGTDPVEWRLTA